MKIHPRVKIVSEAEFEITELIHSTFDSDESYHRMIATLGILISELTCTPQKHNLVIQAAYDEIVHKHALTTSEQLQILSLHLAQTAKYCIRYERHGNFEQEGDLA